MTQSAIFYRQTSPLKKAHGGSAGPNPAPLTTFENLAQVDNSLQKILPPHLTPNPLFHFSEKTDFVPAWDRIRLEHFEPAFAFILSKFSSDVEKIASNPAKANFANTAEAMEKAFGHSIYFLLILYNFIPENLDEKKKYDDVVQKIFLGFDEKFQQAFTNKDLYARFLKASKNINRNFKSYERGVIFSAYINGFNQSGIKLTDEKRRSLTKLNQKILKLSLMISNNMSAAADRSAVVIKDPSRLTGLPEFMIDAAAQRGKETGRPGSWAFGINESTYAVVMGAAEDRSLRRKMWFARQNQARFGKFDNRPFILDLIKSQYKQASILGLENPAQMFSPYRMVKSEKKIFKFLEKFKHASKPFALKEIRILKDYASKTDGLNRLEPWDISFYKQKLQKEAQGFDDDDARCYLELENVLKGSLEHFKKLYKVDFEETRDYPTPHRDVRVFKVSDVKTGNHLGIIFMDLFDREGKPPGIAWNIPILRQGFFEGKVRRPIDMVQAKFTKGAGKNPTLLSHEDLEIFFHEMGHAMNNMLSRCRYQSFSGTSVARDFVEIASQIQERWTFQPEVLKKLALHYKTGKPMPAPLRRKIHKSQYFMQGLDTLNRTMKSWLDMAWYSASGIKKLTSVEAFEKAARMDFSVIRTYGTILSPHFNHIFGGGYEASYYGYQHAEVLADQIFTLFEKNGLYHEATASKLKKLLEKGGTLDEKYAYHKIYPYITNIEHTLEKKGLLDLDYEYFNFKSILKKAGAGSVQAEISLG